MQQKRGWPWQLSSRRRNHTITCCGRNSSCSRIMKLYSASSKWKIGTWVCSMDVLICRIRFRDCIPPEIEERRCILPLETHRAENIVIRVSLGSSLDAVKQYLRTDNIEAEASGIRKVTKIRSKTTPYMEVSCTDEICNWCLTTTYQIVSK